MKKSELKNIISEEIRVALVSELISKPVSGTKAGAVEKLPHRTYQLTSDIEKAKMSEMGGGYFIDLPEGSIVYNLPGGVIVDHPSFEEHPILKRGYMDMGTYAGLAIVQDPNILQQIEDYGIVLGNEKKKYEVSLNEMDDMADEVLFHIQKMKDEDARKMLWGAYQDGHLSSRAVIKIAKATGGSIEEIEKEIKEVYSEKQRRWACAQDDPKFDEMCADTKISKKKVKEAILKALKNG